MDIVDIHSVDIVDMCDITACGVMTPGGNFLTHQAVSSDETRCPDRPTLSQQLTPADQTRVTRPTDSPAPNAPPCGWVGAPDRPTHSEAVLIRRVHF